LPKKSSNDLYTLGALALTVVLFVAHIAIVKFPTEFVFDESTYVPEAINILQGGYIYSFHPPLAKLLIAASIQVIGDNSLGWRLPSVLLGSLSILLTYLMCAALTNKQIAFIASFLFSFDTLVFVHTSIANLDVPSLFFMLAGFCAYLRKKPLASITLIALSGLCKITGFLGIAVIVVHAILSRNLKMRSAVLYGVGFTSSFVVFLLIFDYLAWHRLIDPISHLYELLVFLPLARMGFDRPRMDIESTPWSWLLNPQPIVYYAKLTDDNLYQITYLGFGNPAIWYIAIPAIAAVILGCIIVKDPFARFMIAWFIGTYFLPWYTASFVGRAMFLYYFLPTIPAVCGAIAYGLVLLDKVKPLKKILPYLIPLYLFVVVNQFIARFPVARI